MRLSFGSSTQLLPARLGDTGRASVLATARVPATFVQRLVAVAIVPMVAVTLGLALTSSHLEHPVAAGVYWSYLVAASMAIGLHWWIQRASATCGRADHPDRVRRPNGRCRGVRALRPSEESPHVRR